MVGSKSVFDRVVVMKCLLKVCILFFLKIVGCCDVGCCVDGRILIGWF